MQNNVQNFGSNIYNEKDNFKICLDVQHFLPNEIIVKTNKSEIIIEGKHEERADEHGYISRQFVRRYKLPDHCDTDTVTSNLTKDGVLIINATKKCLKKIENNERIVPIKMCEMCPKLPVVQNEIIQEDFSNNDQFQKINVKLQEKGFESTLDRSRNIKDENCSLLNSVKSLKLSDQEILDEKNNEILVGSSQESTQMLSSNLDKTSVIGKSETFSKESLETMQSEESSFSSSMSFEMTTSNEKQSIVYQ